MALTQIATTDSVSASVVNAKIVIPTNNYISANDVTVTEIKNKELNKDRKLRMGGIL